jgi:uncharacterized protein YdaU (DUF1376 family)
LTWYRRDIRAAIKDMAGLTLDERGAYTSIVDHQYLMGSPLPDDDRYMSGILGCDIRVWRRLRTQLVNKGRITISDGQIADERANYEQAKLQEERNRRAASGQLGGISSGISRRNKALAEATASTPTSQIREEENREYSANADPAALPPASDQGQHKSNSRVPFGLSAQTNLLHSEWRRRKRGV